MVISSLLPGHSILIVENDTDFRSRLVERAARIGLKVEVAEDAPRAIDLLNQAPHDLLVTDVDIGGGSGTELIKKIRRVDPSAQAIVLTGNQDIEPVIDALRAGAYDYLTKPLESLAEFEIVVRRALEHKRLLSENARLFEEIRHLAVTDALTNLYNRRKLEDTMDAEIERASRYRRPLSLIMLDLDGLKRINDTYGHPSGDSVLIAVAQVIRSRIRKVDLATRFGGDEFVIVLPEADEHEATLVARDICGGIAGLKFMGTEMSACAGVVEWEPSLLTREGLLAAVDNALYQAKEVGPGSVMVGAGRRRDSRRYPTAPEGSDVRREAE